MPAVRVEEDAFDDLRYEELAALCELSDADHARGKMIRIWRQCTKENRSVLSVIAINAVLGENGALGIVSSRLGERVADGIRVCGTTGRIEWYENVRNGAKKGGKATKKKWKAPPQALGLTGASPEAKALPQALGGPLQEQEQESLCMDRASIESAPSELSDHGGGDLAQRARAKGKRRSSKSESVPAGYSEAVDAYMTTYQTAYGEKPPFGNRQGGIVKQLLTAHGLPKFLERIGRLFGSPPSWLKPPFDLITLDANWGRLVEVKHDGAAAPHFDPGKHNTGSWDDPPPWDDYWKEKK